MSELSATMQRAVDFARAHGDQLLRFPGGFWGAAPEHKNGIASQVTFGTPTVQALVTRGVAEYSEWQDGRNGRFPVQMKLRTAGVEGRKP